MVATAEDDEDKGEKNINLHDIWDSILLQDRSVIDGIKLCKISDPDCEACQ